MSIEQLLKDREGVTAALCNFINKAEVNDRILASTVTSIVSNSAVVSTIGLTILLFGIFTQYRIANPSPQEAAQQRKWSTRISWLGGAVLATSTAYYLYSIMTATAQHLSAAVSLRQSLIRDCTLCSFHLFCN